MAYTKQDVQDKAELLRESFKCGRLSTKEIAQYESLPGWFWSKQYIPFTKARTMARAQHFINYLDFKAWKRPAGMPSHPDEAYKNSGWAGYGDFLGTGIISSQKTVHMTFTVARTRARAQHLTGKETFSNWSKPAGMPSHPDRVYKSSGWTNWYDFLGNTIYNFRSMKRRTQ